MEPGAAARKSRRWARGKEVGYYALAIITREAARVGGRCPKLLSPTSGGRARHDQPKKHHFYLNSGKVISRNKSDLCQMSGDGWKCNFMNGFVCALPSYVVACVSSSLSRSISMFGTPLARSPTGRICCLCDGSLGTLSLSPLLAPPGGERRGVILFNDNSGSGLAGIRSERWEQREHF